MTNRSPAVRGRTLGLLLAGSSWGCSLALDWSGAAPPRDAPAPDAAPRDAEPDSPPVPGDVPARPDARGCGGCSGGRRCCPDGACRDCCGDPDCDHGRERRCCGGSCRECCDSTHCTSGMDRACCGGACERACM